jgi:hypothetical protein
MWVKKPSPAEQLFDDHIDNSDNQSDGAANEAEK